MDGDRGRGCGAGEGWQADLDAWLARYNSWRKSIEKNEPKELEYSSATAFGPWAMQIVSDWRASVAKVKQHPGWKDQQEAADARLLAAEVVLADYFAGAAEEYQAYAADRLRVAKWKQAPTTGELPFHDERIIVKRSELNAIARGWAQTIGNIERDLIEELTELLPPESRNTEQAVAAEAFESNTARELRQVDKLVTWWVLGIGVLLVIGLLTPLAALGGVVFLLSVMATQPPWVADADTTYFYYQLVEIFALLVLATTWSGRWIGLDFFFARMFAREGIAD